MNLVTAMPRFAARAATIARVPLAALICRVNSFISSTAGTAVGSRPWASAR